MSKKKLKIGKISNLKYSDWLGLEFWLAMKLRGPLIEQWCIDLEENPSSVFINSQFVKWIKRHPDFNEKFFVSGFAYWYGLFLSGSSARNDFNTARDRFFFEMEKIKRESILEKGVDKIE